MKKAKSAKRTKVDDDELLPEYRFDYAKARPNRFADPTVERRTVIVLDADVAKVFTTAESVNSALRALIGAIPSKGRGKRERKVPGAISKFP